MEAWQTCKSKLVKVDPIAPIISEHPGVVLKDPLEANVASVACSNYMFRV